MFRRKPDPAAAYAAATATRTSAIRQPVMHQVGSHRVVVMNPKGGVGKTVTAAMIGHHLSEQRGEITTIVDGNLHTGTLRRRLVPADWPTPMPLLDLADLAISHQINPEWPSLQAFTDLRGRLRVLTNAAANPARVEIMNALQYGAVIQLLTRAAQIIVQDMGTSITGEVSQCALDNADTLVVATDLTQDTLELTIEMLSALAGQPQSYSADTLEYGDISDGRYARLVAGAIVVVNPSRDEDRDPADLDQLLHWLRSVCAAVVLVPRDQHLATGDLIDPAQINQNTTLAHLEVAAHIASRFSEMPISYQRYLDSQQLYVRAPQAL